jgi:hypothetical protein
MVALYFHTKRLEEDRHKRLKYVVRDCITKDSTELNTLYIETNDNDSKLWNEKDAEGSGHSLIWTRY